MAARAQIRLVIWSVLLGAQPAAEAQDRARDAPFSCEPVVAGSIVFRGFALENYSPGPKQLVRFQIEEPYFGVRPHTKELEVPLELEEAIGRGEERIIASSPGEHEASWSTEKFEEELDAAYLKYLRGLRSGKGPGRILGWSDYEGVPLPGTIIRAVGSEHQYETQISPAGIFELSGVAPGKYRVSAVHAQYEMKGLPFEEVEVVPSGCIVVSLPLDFRGRIQGTVRDVHGQPQKGVRVEVMELVGEEEAEYRSKETDSEGNYSFSGVDPGRYRVGVSLAKLAPRQPYPRLYAPGVEEAASGQVIVISEEQPLGDSDLWLPDPKLRRFEIEVRWPDGSPAEGVTIALVYGRWHDSTEFPQANDRGAISLIGYELLDYRIYAYAKSGNSKDEMASVETVVRHGQDKVRLQLVLSEKRTEESIPSPADKWRDSRACKFPPNSQTAVTSSLLY